MIPTTASEKALSQSLLDVLIRAGLIAVLVDRLLPGLPPLPGPDAVGDDPGGHALSAAPQAAGPSWATRTAAPQR